MDTSASAGSRIGQATSELQEYLHTSQLRRHIFPRAALVGFCVGIVAIIFRGLLSGGDAFRNWLIQWAQQSPQWGWIFPVLLGIFGATFSVFLVQHYAPEASGSGIPHLKATLHRLRELRWQRVLPVKIVGGTIAIGSGMALGREGPTVQMGGAIGDAISRWLKVSAQERLVLIAAGAGAGLAAAFNAPLSGLIFILEEVQRDFRPVVFGAAFLAAAVADIVARLASNQLPVFAVPSYPIPPLTTLPFFAVLGVVTGLLGVAYNRGIFITLNLFSPFRGKYQLLLAAVIGAIVGITGWFMPMAVGGGHSVAERVLNGEFVVAAIPLWFLLRFGLTMISYGSGAPGGIFAPLLALGALLGLGVGVVANSVAPTLVPQPQLFAVIGMAAYFTAIVRAPLTGIVLILEMTGNYNQMLPLLVSCFCAYIVAEALRDLPIYEALLERDLLRGGLRPTYQKPIVVEMEIEPGASFVGKQVKELALPAGCILAHYRVDGLDRVPTAATQLEAHMRITALIAPEAANALAILRRGCEAKE